MRTTLVSPGGLSGARRAERARRQAVSFGAGILLLQEGVWATILYGRSVVTSPVAARSPLGDRLRHRDRVAPPGPARRGPPGRRGAVIRRHVTEALMCAGADVYVVGGSHYARRAVMLLARYARRAVLLNCERQTAALLSAYPLDPLFYDRT